jgi:hypothetical protein
MRHFKLAAACGLWLLAVAQAGAEDLTIVSEVVVPTADIVGPKSNPHIMGPKSGRVTLWMTASKLRQSDGYRDWIYDVATGTRIDIDNDRREYWEGTSEQMLIQLTEAYLRKMEADNRAKITENEERLAKARERIAKIDEEMAKVQDMRSSIKLGAERQVTDLGAKLAEVAIDYARKALDELPAMRARMQKPLPAPVGNSVRVERGLGDKRIAGHDSEHYLVWVTYTTFAGSTSTELSAELWGAPNLEVPVSAEVLKQVPLLSGVGLIKGFPLGWTRTYQGGFTVVATEIRRDPIDPSVFAVPPGYTKVDSPLRAVGFYVSKLTP